MDADDVGGLLVLGHIRVAELRASYRFGFSDRGSCLGSGAVEAK